MTQNYILEDDAFTESIEFKSLLQKVNKNELKLKLRPRESKEKIKDLIKKLLAYDLESEQVTPTEAKDLVQKSGMLLILGWDLERAFIFDQIRRQDKVVTYKAFGVEGLQRGSRFNNDSKTLAIWSIAPKMDNPKLMDVQDTKREV